MAHEVEHHFEVAAGTVVGSSHLAMGKANQDAYAFDASGPHLVAVVCDGCGSGAHSEVGAKLGARLVTEQLLRELQRGSALADAETWERLRRDVLALLGGLASVMGGRGAETISAYFLFTIVGLAVSGETACVFSAGDGLIALGDEVMKLGPFPRDEPPYLAYGLLARSPRGEGAPKLTVHRVFPSANLRTALLGTDGAVDLLEASDAPMPAGLGAVGPLRQFWEEDRYFQNPDAVRRRLAAVNRQVTRPVWSEQRIERRGGLLQDDTTLLVLRRR